VETIWGAPKTPFLDYRDRIRIEMNDPQGRSIFGAIVQDVIRYQLRPHGEEPA
jgi:fumarylacetoacetate (FAA) hydrolase